MRRGGVRRGGVSSGGVRRYSTKLDLLENGFDGRSLIRKPPKYSLVIERRSSIALRL